jgi:uncharacterized membrane protein
MSDLVAIAYDNLDTAQQVAANAGEAQKAHLIDLEDLVVVERQMDGKVKLHQPSAAGAGAASGALWGGLIGLIFFVPFFGMAIGAATGAAAGKFSDYGVDDGFMKELGAALEPGKAAVIFLVRKVTVDKVLPEIKIPGKVIQTSLDNETEQRLSDALAAAGAAAPA